MPTLRNIINSVLRLLSTSSRPQQPDARLKPRSKTATPSPRPRTSPEPTSTYPGDFTDRPVISYAPVDDDSADPGEVVWTWVPFEEDPTQGKDRPVLVIGRDGPWLLVLQVTSKNHELDRHQEASQGRFWEDIGTGGWDRERRDSQARVNRIIRINPKAVRRVGAKLDQDTFDRVAERVLTFY